MLRLECPSFTRDYPPPPGGKSVEQVLKYMDVCVVFVYASVYKQGKQTHTCASAVAVHIVSSRALCAHGACNVALGAVGAQCRRLAAQRALAVVNRGAGLALVNGGAGARRARCVIGRA